MKIKLSNFKKIKPVFKYDAVSIGFLVFTLFAMVIAVSDPTREFLYRSLAIEVVPPSTDYFTPTPSIRPTPTRTPTLRPSPTPAGCINSGMTQCEISSNGSRTGNLQVCSGGIWRITTCANGCVNGSCVIATPLPSRTPTRTPTIRPTPSWTPTPSTLPTPYCSRSSNEDCIYGCIADLYGGHCKPAPTRTPTPRPATCSSGTTRCSGSNVEVCSAGVWRAANCTYGCSNGNCNPAPTLRPTPTRTPVIYNYPTTRPTATPLRTPTRIPTAASNTSGYSYNLIVNQDADPNRPGYNCAANPGVCAPGVQVSGFYQAPNGLWYPIAQSAGGPSLSDLQYIQRNYQALLLRTPTPMPTVTPTPTPMLTVNPNSYFNYPYIPTPTPRGTPFDIVAFMNSLSNGPSSTIPPAPSATPASTPFSLSNWFSGLYNSIFNPASPTPSPTPYIGLNLASNDYSCPDNYLVRQNRFGAYYCEEDTSQLNSDEWRIACDSRGCMKCDLGLVGLCYALNSTEATLNPTTITTVNPTRRNLGDSCSTNSDCGSGMCSSSWISTDGSQNVSIRGKVCTYSQSEQDAYSFAASERQTETVQYVSAGLALPTGANLLSNVTNSTVTIFGQSLTLTPPRLVIAALGTYVTNLLGTNTQDIVASSANNFVSTILNPHSPPSFYSPSLDARIIYQDDTWYNATTGEALPQNSNQTYLSSNTVYGQGIQHATITENTFESDEWQNLRSNVEATTAVNPTNIAAITESIAKNVTYNQESNATFFGRLEYLSQNRNLENLLAQDQTICFDLAITQQAYLAQQGIQSELTTFVIHQPNVVGDHPQTHTSVVVTDKNGNKFIAEPTSGYVAPYDEWLEYMQATDVQTLPSVFANTGSTAQADIVVVPNVDIETGIFTSAILEADSSQTGQ